MYALLNFESIDFGFGKGFLEVTTVGGILTSTAQYRGKEGPGSSYIYLCEILQNKLTKVMKTTSEATETQKFLPS